MNVLKAIRWGIAAWEEDVSPSTIVKCWLHAKVTSSEAPSRDLVSIHATLLEEEIEAIIRNFSIAGQIQAAMSLNNFINPVEEEVEDNDADITEQILARFAPERDAETDEELEEITPVTLADAQKALTMLQQFDSQLDPVSGFFSQFRAYGKLLQQAKAAHLSQTTLEQWITK